MNFSSLRTEQLNELVSQHPTLGVVVAIGSIVTLVLTTWMALGKQWFAYRGQSLTHRSKRQDSLLKALKEEDLQTISPLRLQLLVERVCGVTLEAETLRFVLTRGDPAILLYHLRRGRRHVKYDESRNGFVDQRPSRRVRLSTVETIFSFLTVMSGVVFVLMLIAFGASGWNWPVGVLATILLPLIWTLMEIDLAAYSAGYLITHSPFVELPITSSRRKTQRRSKRKIGLAETRQHSVSVSAISATADRHPVAAG